MGKLVTPKVYFVGETKLREGGLQAFLEDSGNMEFMNYVEHARADGLSDSAIIMSCFAKLCYASLSLGHNANITRVRGIEDNIKAVFDSGHGSILEHIQFNFIINNCSRVFTHELVRHRVGTAFSQTSGRYCRLDDIDLVFDPILEPVREDIMELQLVLEMAYANMVRTLGLDNEKDFDKKKKITSALRRIAPNGQANQMAFSLNLRTLRHTVMARTARHAEWEIRNIFVQIYRLIKTEYPLFFHGAQEGFVENEFEISGMKIQPWEKSLCDYTPAELRGAADQLELAQ